MKKDSLLIFVLVSIYVSGQELIDDGCIVACTPEKNAECFGRIFPAIYDPSFCGLMPDGQWRNYTFECQACNAGAIAVDEGACTCEQIACHDGFTCIDHECVPIISPDPCYPQVSSPAGCILSCEDPYFDDCEDVFIKIYRPSFCAWTSSGKWVNYTFDCQACQNPQVLGILQGACSCSNMVCPGRETCVDGKCIEPTLFCKNSQCDKGYVCQSGRCVSDPCSGVLCEDGQVCVDGECTVEGCAKGYICQKGRCMNDPCHLVDCGLGQVCKDGICVEREICSGPFPTASADGCTKGFVCRNKVCNIDPCFLVDCPKGERCVNGICEKKCKAEASVKSDDGCPDGCPLGFTCVNGTCIIMSCAKNRPCLSYELCTDDQYVDNCANIQCVGPCRRGVCICRKNKDCAPGQTCQEGQCVDTCSVQNCPPPGICVNGNCVLSPPPPPPPPKIECWNNEDCEQCEECHRGMCKPAPVRDLPVCPTKAQYRTKECINRPTQEECRERAYINIPPPLFCGVTSKGERKNFIWQCEACLDEQIEYYFDVACYFAPQVCQEVEVCSGHECVRQCYADEDCKYSWQMCLQGVCTDRCALMKCADCKYGVCGYGHPSEHCDYDLDCSNSAHSCASNLCVDECLFTPRCPSGRSCWKGHCYPLQ